MGAKCSEQIFKYIIIPQLPFVISTSSPLQMLEEGEVILAAFCS
jgi:hypothetical protein